MYKCGEGTITYPSFYLSLELCIKRQRHRFSKPTVYCLKRFHTLSSGNTNFHTGSPNFAINTTPWELCMVSRKYFWVPSYHWVIMWSNDDNQKLRYTQFAPPGWFRVCNEPKWSQKMEAFTVILSTQNFLVLYRGHGHYRSNPFSPDLVSTVLIFLAKDLEEVSKCKCFVYGFRNEGK